MTFRKPRHVHYYRTQLSLNADVQPCHAPCGKPLRRDVWEQGGVEFSSDPDAVTCIGCVDALAGLPDGER